MTDIPDSVFLFAAGFGTRMGELTQDRPKPLIDVAGRPLIDHCLQLAAEIRPGRVVANLHYKAEMLAAYLEPKGVLVSIERPDILETGGGLRAALPLLGSAPVYTVNTDAIWAGPNPLQLLRAAWDPEKMDALLMCVAPEQAIGHHGPGDFSIDGEGRINRSGRQIYGGVQILKTEGLLKIAEPVFSLNRLWDQMHDKSRLFGMTYSGRWCDVGHPDGIQQAESLLLENDV